MARFTAWQGSKLTSDEWREIVGAPLTKKQLETLKPKVLDTFAEYRDSFKTEDEFASLAVEVATDLGFIKESD